MKLITATVLFGLTAFASARISLVRRQDARASDPTDVQILNFALTLEYLENAFYSGALAKFSQADFIKAGLPVFARGRFEQISTHEASHVAFLQQALGNQSTRPCTYNFPYNDPRGFVALSSALESVGASAYTGAAKFISDKACIQHSGWVESTIRKGAPWGTAYETPLDLNQVFTLASAFIVACPETNPELPVTAFPPLSTAGPAIAGGNIGLNYTVPSSSDTLYAVFLNGANSVVVALSSSKTQVTVPSSLRGYTYLSVSTDPTGLDSSKTVAGPTILDLSFDSANNPALLDF
ncbi:ferritin-like domain-containing protein [Vararia minispora EC-137]|uniref:Ferritin-like domain-containing protein n=1 Tax=Vararia minispora EC-137 TaxID=1314806 RepID=A0ACB8QJD5_9AGAM|nr:ferritin-like domain-containing protein [Vararia minispora EC-137]